MVKCLEERNFPTETIALLDKQCIGETRNTKFGPVKVEELPHGDDCPLGQAVYRRDQEYQIR